MAYKILEYLIIISCKPGGDNPIPNHLSPVPVKSPNHNQGEYYFQLLRQMEKWLKYALLLWLNIMVNVEEQDAKGDLFYFIIIFFLPAKLETSLHFSILFSFLPGLGKLEGPLFPWVSCSTLPKAFHKLSLFLTRSFKTLWSHARQRMLLP